MTASRSLLVDACLSPRQEQLVVEAAQLFASRGYAAASMQQLAARAQITAGAIYRHFPSKGELLHAILHETAARLARCTSGHRALEPLLRAATDEVVGSPGMLATYVRERKRCTGRLHLELAGQELQLMRTWISAAGTDRALPRRELLLRQQAVTGVLASLSSHPRALAAPRARTLVVDSLRALSIDTTCEATDRQGSGQTTWRPTPTRRQQIMAVAMRLFSERGYQGVGLNEVGIEAGLAGPSIYEHFDSKAAILLEAYDQAGAIVVAGVVEALSTAESADHALHRLAGSYAHACAANVALLTVTAQEDSWVPSTERPRLARRRREIEETWTSVLREVRPELTAADARLLVRAALPMARHLARLRGEASTSADHVAHLLHTFLAAPAAG